MANNRNQASAHRLITTAIAFAVGFGLHRTTLIFGFAGLRTLRGGSEASTHESMQIHSPLT